MAAVKKAPARNKAEDEYLHSTKLYCGKCNCYMVGESGTSKTAQVYRYYKCVSVKNHRGCDKKTVRKDWIEDLVLKEAEKILFNDELIERIADRAMELQGKDNTVLPLLQKQYAEAQRGIDNMLNAMQQGIITPSTKERLENLEKQKNEIAAQIVKEELAKPTLTKEKILFWFDRFRRLNTKRLDHKRRLIDSFVNSVYLYIDNGQNSMLFRNRGDSRQVRHGQERVCRAFDKESLYIGCHLGIERRQIGSIFDRIGNAEVLEYFVQNAEGTTINVTRDNDTVTLLEKRKHRRSRRHAATKSKARDTAFNQTPACETGRYWVLQILIFHSFLFAIYDT